MGRIKKVAGPKHEATLPPVLNDFVTTIPKLPLAKLPKYLSTFPVKWPFPRGDLYHWIPALDHFDAILEQFVQQYGLNKGPQTQGFGAQVLAEGLPEKDKAGRQCASSPEEIAAEGFNEDGDREAVEAILGFSRMLMENCGNRSLYNSSERLGDLLNTTSLSLLLAALHLAGRLASRYHYSRARHGVTPQNLHPNLLASHYNINFHHVQKLADSSVKVAAAANTNADSHGTDQDATSSDGRGSSERTVHGNDLFAVAISKKSGKQRDASQWDHVVYDYYDTGVSSEDTTEDTQNTAISLLSPIRRSSGNTPRARPLSGVGETGGFLNQTNGTRKEESVPQNGRRTFNISRSELESQPLEMLLGSLLSKVPKASHYDLLNRLRFSKALCGSTHNQSQLLALRILAVTNLAYIYPETLFQQQVLQQDSDQPRHLQLVEQLRKLVHDPENGRRKIPIEIKTIALGAMESLLKHKARFADVISALGINVSHGMLLHILRQEVADLASSDPELDSAQAEDWREALFSLLESLPSPNSRTADTLVAAGLFEILVDAIKLRTERAERVMHKVLVFLNSITHGVRDAHQTFASNGGLEAIADLILWEVNSSLERVKSGDSLSEEYRSQVMDYQMPFFQQQTLRWLLKFISGMMHYNNANVDRLLRNLIDTPPLLTGLRQIIANGKIFGSNVWSSAVNIMSSFIHNEPTSYAVMVEAGLSKALLGAVSGKIADWDQAPETSSSGNQVCVVTQTDDYEAVEVEYKAGVRFEKEKSEKVYLSRTSDETPAAGILPASDSIVCIPNAFGAICLNASGLELFLKSGALDAFFEVFESPSHTKSLINSPDFSRMLGTSFEELIRHHPRLKPAIMRAVVLMVARVAVLCKRRAEEEGEGPKLDVTTNGTAFGTNNDHLGNQPDDDVVMTEPHTMPAPHDFSSGKEPTVSVAEYLSIVCGFLIGFCENQSLCLGLIQSGGLKFLLDLATVRSLPHDFHGSQGSETLSKILHVLAEHKPHLVLPALITRAIQTLDHLEPFLAYRNHVPFFTEYLEARDVKGKSVRKGPKFEGTAMITTMVRIQTLTTIIAETFSPSTYSSRPQQTLFNQVNLIDMYKELVNKLGQLHRSCVWEEVMLQKTVPESLKESTKANKVNEGSPEANAALGIDTLVDSHPHAGQQNGEAAGTASEQVAAENSVQVPLSNGTSDETKTQDTTLYQNIKPLRFLLSLIPRQVTSFFSSLGRALLLKRRSDTYQRQGGYAVANALAQALHDHLQYGPPDECEDPKDRLSYFLVILTSLGHILVYGSAERSPTVCCTVVLSAFKKQSGLEILSDVLHEFFDVVQMHSENDLGLKTCAISGMKLLLTMFADIVQAKTVIESPSAQGMATGERDKENPLYFSPPQFLVEVRSAVLSAVQDFWGSSLAEHSSSSIVHHLLDILRTILEADQESGAHKRGDTIPVRKEAQAAKLSIDDNRLDQFQAGGRDRDLAYEALFRTFKNREAAEEYCDTRMLNVGLPELPAPEHEREKKEAIPPPQPPSAPHSTPRAQSQASEEAPTGEATTVPEDDASISSEPHSDSDGSEGSEDDHPEESQGEQDEAGEDRHRSPTEPNSVASAADIDGEGMAMSIDSLLNLTDQAVFSPQLEPQAPVQQAPDVDTGSSLQAVPQVDAKPTQAEGVITVNDLQEARDSLRGSLIENVLDILSVHDDITFDLADLITTAASKAPEGSNMHKEIGETLVQSLISFQMEDDFRPMGKKIASYANLLAILMQQIDFYEATLDVLQENFSQLLGFVKVFHDQPVEERSPWVGQVLLVLEKLLAEDCKPHLIQWIPPDQDGLKSKDDPLAVHEPLVPLDEKLKLFSAVSDILPKVGKDHSLALSVVRVLVILTRNREIANALGEKQPLQRLFVMVKQVAGVSDDRFQKAFMLILRHIIEDDATVQEMMRQEIVEYFISNHGRAQDTSAFVRQLAHLVLRSPLIFLQVVNEKLKLQNFDHNSRTQNLILKDYDEELTKAQQQGWPPADKPSPQSDNSPEAASAPVQPSTEGGADAETTEEPLKGTDMKTPVLEKPDGVVHFLLSQLLSYKHVEDKDVDVQKDTTAPASGASTSTSEPAQSENSPADPTPSDDKKSAKAEYKPEEHPIYNYRCFLLQCLTELLMSYNSAKIEFINFSRKADPKAMTPSKPRSGVLNYLLSNLVPLGSLERQESIAFKQKFGLSQWSMCAIVGLCIKPSASSIGKEGEIEEDKDPDLLFVRKFVLENLLKTFKDANAANEPLEQKYSRLMSLADLFYRLLLARIYPNISAYAAEQTSNTHREIARVMFEKSFISALTTAIADIDLNFPSAKRAVKYILRPLKILTDTGVYLSQHSDLSPVPGQTEDDEISTASSVSDANDGREETPDLFRNSTLGILEPGREEDMSSESSDEDEDMLDEEYDEGAEYEEGIDQDDDEVVSEEEMGEAGPMEGMPGDVGMDVEVVIDEDDDEGDDGSLDSDDDMDGGEEMDEMDEINGDDENGSLNDGDAEDWQDEDDDDDGEEDEVEDFGENVNEDEELIGGDADADPESTAVQDLVRDLERDVFSNNIPGLGDLGVNVENGRYMVGGMDLGQADMDMEHGEQDVDDEDDEEDVVEEAVTFEPDYEDDDDDDEDGGQEPPPWGWDPYDDEEVIPAPRHHPHHARVRGNASPWTVYPPGTDPGSIGVPRPPHFASRLTMPGARGDRYRSHRPTGGPRGSEDGLNPLLQRPDPSSSPRRGVPPHIHQGFADWLHMIHPNRGGTDHSAVSFINNIMSAITRGVLDNQTGTFRVRVDRPGGPPGGGGPGPFLTFDDGFHALMDRHHRHHHNQHTHDPTRPVREDSSLVPLFYPSPTPKRWQEEANLLFGATIPEKTQRVLNSLLALLVPPALEEEKVRKVQEAAAEEARKKQQEEERVREAERLAKEKEEREAQEQKEREERETAEREAAAQSANQQTGTEPSAAEGEPMEGVETTAEAEPSAEPETQEHAEAGPSTAEAGPSTTQERVRATIRGREVDITGMGIDLEYLNALPEEFREEVLMQQVAEQRSQAANAGEPPTEITREFLDALPADIREEIMQQEAQDRRRRERDEARRQAAASGEADAAARAEDMDPASFFASLDPVLRHAVLLDQDDDMLAQLPAALRAEAEALGAEREFQNGSRMQRSNAQRGHRTTGQLQPMKKKPRRQVVQMVDKAGIATLLRLLFIQQNTAKDIFYKILENISQNRQNRAEVLTLLLSILQEGSVDINAVERSFIQLTSRAKQPLSQKTPQTLKRGRSGSISSPLNSEMTPLMVMQQCLTVLVHLTGTNIHVPSYFLTEHELSTTLRSKSTKKGKGKESRAAKFPLNSLLGLLDRKMIMESAGCMEQLSTLLRSITYPLTILRKKDKDKAPEESKDKPEQTSPDQPETAQPGAEGESPSGNMEGAEPTTGTTVETNTADQDGAQNATEAVQPAEDAAVKKKEDEAKEEDAQSKKQRTLVPPVIPESNLRLVVGILAARDCSSKTFRETLSTIDNLSSIPSTRPIFGQELIKEAQRLGDQISTALDELIPQIQKAETNADAQSTALAKFQPSSSDQAKLLRVLTALDYLFDPKRHVSKSSEGDELEAEVEVSKDYLTNLYENATFGPLWSKLSECLSSMRQDDQTSTLNVATILLPLVEALMVVCKNTTPKESSTVKDSKDFAVTSPQPESRMESLFFRFTEDHRKVLNNLVRQNPRLMSGTFSILVKNPKVLDFDNKRNYFIRRLHTRADTQRPPQPPLQISVRRDQAFMDSYSKLSYRSADEIKFGKLSVRFQGEDGVDAGGVTREWFQVMSRQMFNPDYALFVPVASDRTTFHPNKLSEINPEHLAFFKFIGRIIGKALYEGRALDCHFSRAVYKRILGKTVSIKDMETLDLDYYKSLLWMLENDISDIITETFSIEAERFGATEVIDLMENGRNIPVTEENKQEYVQLVVEYRLTGSVTEQLEEFLKGFHDIVPAGLISIFNEQELELLISGLPDIDVDDWKSHSEYHNYTASSPQIQWFWRAVRSFDKEERAKLLQFVTGTSKVPLNGFKELEGMNGFSRFNVHRDYGNKDRLPSSHTCFNQLDLPEYDDYETLRKLLHTAMTAGSEYFGFA